MSANKQITAVLLNPQARDGQVGNFILSKSIRGNDGLPDVFLYSNAKACTSEIGTQVLKKLL